MCVCFYSLKCLREQDVADALWAYDPGPGSTATARWARHAIGPAPSLASCVGFIYVANTMGALFDRTGYISAVFSLTNLSAADPISAWNGTDTAWFFGNPTGSTGSNWYSFDLSGTQIASARYDTANRFHVACNASGDLIAFNYFSSFPFVVLQRRTRTGTVAASVNMTAAPLSVDASGNVIVGQLSSLVKYNSSLASQWSSAYPASGDVPNAVVCDSPSAVYVVLTQSPPATAMKVAKYNSSGLSQWTVTTGFNGLTDSIVDFWCDGSNVYLAVYVSAGPSAGMTVQKYDGSGTQLWSRIVWYDDNTTTRRIRSVRSDGVLMTLAGTRGQ